jgi:hypothetical protein
MGTTKQKNQILTGGRVRSVCSKTPCFALKWNECLGSQLKASPLVKPEQQPWRARALCSSGSSPALRRADLKPAGILRPDERYRALQVTCLCADYAGHPIGTLKIPQVAMGSGNTSLSTMLEAINGTWDLALALGCTYPDHHPHLAAVSLGGRHGNHWRPGDA